MDDFRSGINRRTLLRSTGLLALGAVASPFLAGIPPALAQAEPNTDLPYGNGYYRFKIGEFNATIISDGGGVFPVWPPFAGNASEAEVMALLDANMKPFNWQVTSNMLVIDTGKERVMVDTGVAGYFGPTWGKVIANLERAGMAAASIDVIVLTHGHIDHIAGILGPDGKPAFPKARYVFAEDEWAYWTGDQFESDLGKTQMPDEMKQGMVAVAKSTLPMIAGQTDRIKADGEVVGGIHLIPSPGHSPAHSSILIASGNEQLICFGDVVHNPITGIQRPDWSPVFDQDAAKAVVTRKAMLDRVATDRTLALGYHFPFPGIGYVAQTNGGYRWEPVNWTW